jgi:hypothetical protein
LQAVSLKIELQYTWHLKKLAGFRNNHLDDKDFVECFRNNEEDKGNEAGFSLHDTPSDCLF